jgi:hypothetical protein
MLADYMKTASGELLTANMLFWQKCESGEISKSEISELFLRLKQTNKELRSALEICEGLEKISKFKIENKN